MTLDAVERSVGSDVVAAAIFVIEMEDVLVAKMACEGQIFANCEKMLVFRSTISCDSLADHHLSTCSLEPRSYRYRFDNKINVLQILHLCAGLEQFPGCCGIVLGYAFLVNIFGEQSVWLNQFVAHPGNESM